MQYGKINRGDNIHQIKNELVAHNIQFENNTIWVDLLNILKADKKDYKYFLPKTDYSAFIISDLKRLENRSQLKYSDLLTKDNIKEIRDELSDRNVEYNSNTNWKDLIALLKTKECHPNHFFT